MYVRHCTTMWYLIHMHICMYVYIHDQVQYRSSTRIGQHDWDVERYVAITM